MRYFDYEEAARDAGIGAEQLQRICGLVREEFPGDEMMFELHVLRVCHAVKDGRLTLEDALRPESRAPVR